MNRRWVCPLCNDGCNAPSRLQLDDIRGYCLMCSKTTGRLVHRRCPAKEKERQAKFEADKAKEKAKMAKAREKKAVEVSTYPGNLPKAFARYSRLKAWEADLTRVPFELRVSQRKPYTSGRCWGISRIVLTVGTDVAQAHEVILHELAHAATACLSRRLRKVLPSHGTAFLGFLMTAATELVGHPVQIQRELGKRLSCWMIDRGVEEAIRQWLHPVTPALQPVQETVQ